MSINYRQMHDLFSDTLAELRDALNDNSSAIRNYQSLIDLEQKNIDSRIAEVESEIKNTIWTGKLSEEFVEKVSAIFGLKNFVVERIIKLQIDKREKNKIDVENKQTELKKLNKEIKEATGTHAELKVEYDNISQDMVHVTALSNKVKSLIEDKGVTHKEIESSKSLGFISRVFNTNKNYVNSCVLEINSLIDKLQFTDSVSGDFFTKSAILETEIFSALQSIKDRQSDFKASENDLERLKIKKSTLTSEINSLQGMMRYSKDSEIADSIIAEQYQKAMSDPASKENILKQFISDASIKSIKQSEIKIDATRKIISGLKEQARQIEKTMLELEAPMSKLKRAKSKAGSKTAKFDDVGFKRSMDSALSSYKRTNTWAQSNYQNMRSSNHYHYSGMTSGDMLLWFIIMDSTHDNMAGAVLHEQISEIQQSVVSDAASIPELDIEIPGIDTSALQAMDIGSVDVEGIGAIGDIEVPNVEIEMPNIEIEVPRIEVPDIPAVEVPSFNEPSGGGFGGGFGGGDSSPTSTFTSGDSGGGGGGDF